MKKLYLVDGHSYLYRAFYAIRNLTTKQGIPTGAVYGFINMLLRIMNDHPDMIIIAFDSKAPSFRKEKYQEYKIHRKPMPDDLISQIPIIKEILESMKIHSIEIPGFEADDILATLAKKAEKQGINEIVIFSNDKDILQIVNDQIQVQTESSEPIKYTIEEVKNRFGNPPEHLPDILALAGDASDNVPGVPGIGQKTAIKLVQEFGSLENIKKNISQIKSSKVKDLLEKNISDAELSYDLVMLDKEVPIEVNFEDCAIKKFDYLKLGELLQKLEFTSLMQKLIPNEEKKLTYEIIDNEKSLNDLVETLVKTKEFSIDFCSAGDDSQNKKLIGIAFSISEKMNFYIPLIYDLLSAATQLEAGLVIDKLKIIFENSDIKKIGHNIKYCYIVLNNFKVKLNGISFDTAIASYLINSSRQTHTLEDLASEYLRLNKNSEEKILGKGKKELSWEQVDVNVTGQFFCENTNIIFELKNLFENLLVKENTDKIFYTLEMPLVEILALMEIAGISLDVNHLEKIKQEVSFMLKKYEKSIYEFAKEEFNINSPQQLSKILFDKLKLPAKKKGKTGFSTGVEVLEELALNYELPLLVLNYRQLAKLNSTYIDALPALIGKASGRLHTSFNQTVTATGRLSSSNPNLQNIPIKSEFGKLIRRAFIAHSKNWKLISCDYSQVELRILAHFSKDENLIKAFKENADVHIRTACELFNLSSDKIDDRLRSIAKTINFGIVYGMSPYGLSRDLKITKEEAGNYIDNYFLQYKEVKTFIDNTISEAKKNGYVTTILGRKRYIPELNSGNRNLQEFGERMAVNTPIQGSAADLIKIAMLKIHEELQNKKIKTKMILQVHDELIFESPDEEVDEVIITVKNIMENALPLLVPLKVNTGVGNNWLDLE